MLSDELLGGDRADGLPADGLPADGPGGGGAPVSRRARSPRRRVSGTVWAVAVIGLVLLCLGLATVPLAVIVASALVLGAALFWTSRARRSAGASFVPTAATWAAAVALLLSIGAVSLQGVVGNWAAAFAGAPAGPARQVPAAGAGSAQAAAPAPSSAIPSPTAATPTPTVGAQLPTPEVPPAAVQAVPAAQAPEPSAVAPEAPAPTPSYKNCRAVHAAGIPSLVAGQPGYSRKLDPDGNGVACTSG